MSIFSYTSMFSTYTFLKQENQIKKNRNKWSQKKKKKKNYNGGWGPGEKAPQLGVFFLKRT